MKKLFAMMLVVCMLLTGAAALADEPITLRVAHIGPTTGAAALYGLATLHGAEVAVAELNASDSPYHITYFFESLST